jgi:hypothetical protein
MVTDEGMPSSYTVYLLRLWQVETEVGPAWRMVLEDPQTAERRGFADPTELLTFLSETMGIAVPSIVEDDGEHEA